MSKFTVNGLEINRSGNFRVVPDTEAGFTPMKERRREGGTAMKQQDIDAVLARYGFTVPPDLEQLRRAANIHSDGSKWQTAALVLALLEAQDRITRLELELEDAYRGEDA